jgi:hypothetical protein
MKKFLLLGVFLFLGLLAHAQVTNSAVAGSVRDANGEGIIGATVQFVHTPTGTYYGTVTNELGLYSIPNVKSGGPYKVEITYVGYQSDVNENIFIPLGAEFVYNKVLSEGVLVGEVEVVGTRDNLINSNRTGASTNITTEQLNSLPTISRSISDFTRLTPQAQAGSGFGGRDGRYNNIQIDGANFNNNFGLSSNNLPGGDAQPISLDAIEQVQVNIAPFDVRQTNFTGAGINAITRSGTNTLSGSAYTYYRNQDFNGGRVASDTVPPGDKTTSRIIGARLGGALIKNKLFFFVNGEFEKNVSPGITILPSAPGRSGINISRTTVADMQRVKDFVQEKYGYDAGRIDNYANEFASQNYKGLARLDWNINKNNTFTVRYNQVISTNDQTVNNTSAPNPRSASSRISLQSYAFENANYQFENSVRSFTAELNSKIKSNLSNQFIGTYTRIQDRRTSNSDLFPFIDIKKDGDAYMSLGYELFSFNNNVENDVYTFTNNLTYTKGAHTITAGASFDLMNFTNAFQRYGTSYYRYDSLSQFLNNQTPSAFGKTYSTQAGVDIPLAELSFGIGGIYLQDQYRFSDKFKVTAGVRVDMPFYFNDLPRNPSVEALNFVDALGQGTTKLDVSAWPTSKPLISPRVGFNYDPTGKREIQLRGGTGIFTGRAPFVWFTNIPNNSGMIQNTVELVGAAVRNAGITFDPNIDAHNSKIFAEAGKVAPGSIAAVSSDLKLPQVWRSNLAVDLKLPGNTVFGLEGLYTKDIVNLIQYNANQRAPIGFMNAANGADKRPIYGNTNTLRRVNASMSEAMVLTNTDQGSSYSLTSSLSKDLSNGLFASLAYTYTNAVDLSGNPGAQAASAWANNNSVRGQNDLDLQNSAFAVPHRVVGSLSYRVNYLKNLGTTVSLFYEGTHQGRFSYRYTSDFNLDGINADLIYIPKDASEITFTDIRSGATVLFTAAQQSEAFFKYVEQDKYLSANKGSYAERNGALLPWRNRFDFKLLQDVFTNIKGKKNTLQFSLDILNVSNLINSNWGIRQFTSLSNGAILAPTVNATAGTATYQLARVRNALPTNSFTNLVSTSGTWGAQAGLRFIF